jgi:hypothetical protein
MLNVMLSVSSPLKTLSSLFCAECHYAESQYAESQYAESQYAESQYA